MTKTRKLRQWHSRRCYNNSPARSPSAGQERQVRRAPEGPVRGELPAHEGPAGDGAAAEGRREEELPAGGEGRRPEQAAAQDCPGLTHHVAPRPVAPIAQSPKSHKNHYCIQPCSSPPPC